MVRMFVRHNVAEYDAWRKVYDEFDVDRTPLGVRADAVYQSADDPNDVTVTHDFEDADTAKAFVASPELHAAMERAGVQGEPQIWFAREVT